MARKMNRLVEFRAKWISKLSLYNAEKEREKEIIQILISKLSVLRSIDISRLARLLYGMKSENVSDGFKSLLNEMLADILAMLESKQHSHDD